ncbi:hypothetical protein BGZ76_008022 [Entomortierella beljakovae]|nr:hypothetical protein BGZ76_008022 [Entomortierella beljakovae]
MQIINDKNQAPLFTSPSMEPSILPPPKPHHSADYLAAKRQRTDSGVLPGYDGLNVVPNSSMDTSLGNGYGNGMSYNGNFNMTVGNGEDTIEGVVQSNTIGNENGSTTVVLPGINSVFAGHGN